jgi:hypothetical protein
MPSKKKDMGFGGFSGFGDPFGQKSKSKFGNKKVVVDGVTFDSEGEYSHYCKLKLLERTGQIRNLKHHVSFELIPSQIICGKRERGSSYEADFVYEKSPDWKTVIEDYKGYRTDEYILKRKMMKYLLKLEVVEVKAK